MICLIAWFLPKLWPKQTEHGQKNIVFILKVSRILTKKYSEKWFLNCKFIFAVTFSMPLCWQSYLHFRFTFVSVFCYAKLHVHCIKFLNAYTCIALFVDDIISTLWKYKVVTVVCQFFSMKKKLFHSFIFKLGVSRRQGINADSLWNKFQLQPTC